jgi:hypothetical protein
MARWLNQNIHEWQMAIDPKTLNLSALEKQHGLPSGLLESVMRAESAGNPTAVSPAGAQGLFQFMPATAKAYGVNPFDPQSSAVGAARMYGDLSKQFDGDMPSMLAAYNWGSGNLTKKGLQNAPQETRDYIAKVQAGMAPANKQYADSGQFMNDADPVGELPPGAVLLDDELPEGAVLLDELPKGATLINEPKTPTDSSIGATIRDKALEGATFGLGNRLQAGLAGLVSSQITGKPFEEEYKRAREISLGNLKAQSEENPATSLLANLAGGIALGGAGTGALAKYAPNAATKLQAVAAAAPYKTAAGIGAGTGALYGAGTSDKDLADSGTEAVVGGIAGALAGPAATYVGRNVIAPVYTKVAEKTGLDNIVNKFGRKATTPKNTGTIATAPATAPANTTQQTFAPDLIKPKGEYFSKTAGQRTQSPIAQRLENDARAGLVNTNAESAIRNADVVQNREFTGFIDRLAGKMDANTDVNALVEGIGSTIKSKAADQKAVVKSAYDLAKEGKGVKIGIEDIRKGLWRGIVDAKKEGAYDLTQMPKASAVLKRLADYSKNRGISKVTSVKLGEMENFRKQISNATNSSQDPTERKFLGDMLRNYDGFMERTAANAVDIGDAQAINAFKKAVASRREYGQLFEKNKMVEEIVSGNQSVDDTVKALIGTGSIKGKKQMADNLNAIVGASRDQGDAVKADLRQAFMKKVFEKSTLGTEPNNPNMPRLSPAKLKTELENLFVNQSQFSKQLYGDDAHKAALQAIKELELISTTQANVKNASGSGELVGRLIKVMGKVPVVGKVAGPLNSVAESSTKFKNSQEVIKGLSEFGESLKSEPMRSTFWAIQAPVGLEAVRESDKAADRPLRITITPQDKLPTPEVNLP